MKRLRRLLCRLFGHRSYELRIFQRERRMSITRCRRCGVVLGHDFHRARFPLPVDRVQRG